MWTKSKQKKNQVKSDSDWPCVLLFDLAYKKCNGIIKGWRHCHTSEWKGRFLVNNKLFGSAWCGVMAEICFSLLKKIKIGHPEHLLIPTPYVQYLIFALLSPPSPPPFLPHTHTHTPYTPLKVDVICLSPLYVKDRFICETGRVVSDITEVMFLILMVL